MTVEGCRVCQNMGIVCQNLPNQEDIRQVFYANGVEVITFQKVEKCSTRFKFIAETLKK